MAHDVAARMLGVRPRVRSESHAVQLAMTHMASTVASRVASGSAAISAAKRWVSSWSPARVACRRADWSVAE